MNIVSTKLMGGLGNYLFQIATAYSISLRDNKTLICDNNDVLKIHRPYTVYIDNIFRNVKFNTDLPEFKMCHEPNFHYTEIPQLDGDIKLSGYFQSEKYFSMYRDDILSLFKMDEYTSSYINEKYGDILKNETCSIHVRRGNYLSLQHCHPIQSISYYQNSINEIGLDKHYLIFSDDIEWCKNNFNFIPNKTFIEGNEDYQDLYLMSMCQDNIIANSSFSWWGGWLNENENKKVIAPLKWFGVNNLHLITDSLYCDKWKIL